MRQRITEKYVLALLAVVLLPAMVKAQEVLATGDGRGTVADPGFYPTCSTLTASLYISAGEPSSETSFDTSRIQTALNACGPHHAVELAASGANNAFLIQPLTIPSGVTLLVDGGVTVFASRNPADYQKSGGETCGTIGTHGGGCVPLITANHGTSGGSAVEGYGVIDGRGGDKLIVGGVVQTYSWWDQTTSSSTSRTQNKPVMLNAGTDTSTPTNNFTLYKITFKNAPYFNVQWAGNNFTAWGVKVNAPGTAPNTDGIDPRGSNMTITNSYLSDGDDTIAVKADDPASNITVSNVNTYSGHGISVGSQTEGGLNNMLVININQLGDGKDAGGIGLRLKSDGDAGGLVQNVTYENVCSSQVHFPMVINPNYGGRDGDSPPTFTNIVYKNIHVITNEGTGSADSGKYQFQGYGPDNRTTMTLDNVIIHDPDHSLITPADQYVNITLGPGHDTDPFLTDQTGTGVHKTYADGYPDGSDPYPCLTSQIPLLNGELYLQTSTANNLQILNTSASGSVTLNAVVQTSRSQVSYTRYDGNSYTGAPAPTATVTFYDGATSLGSGTLGSNGTLATYSLSLTGLSSGTHTITAQYNGDTHYPAFTFGSAKIVIP